MGSSDVLSILNSMTDIVSDSGSITTIENMNSLIKIMQCSNKLVTQCLCMNILHNTTNVELLTSFINDGGWDILFEWISKSKPLLKNSNDDFSCYVMEILKVYERLPVTVEDLKRNSCAKTIKSLSKTSHQDIKILASRIVSCWMSKVKSQQESQDKASSHKKHKKNKHHSKENDMSNFNNIDSLTIIPSSKPKTTKSLPTKFRSTGLLEANEPVIHRKKDDSSLKRTSGDLSNVDVKRSKTNATAEEISEKIHEGHKSVKSSSIHEVYESSGFMDAIALQKRKSDMGYYASAKRARQKKTINKSANSPTRPMLSPSESSKFFKDRISDIDDESVGKNSSSPVLSESCGDSRTDNFKTSPNHSNTSPVESPLSSPVHETSSSQQASSPTRTMPSPIISCSSPTSIDPSQSVLLHDLACLGKPKRKKTVSWAKECNLKSFFYFELDETERVNVNRISFDEIRKQEQKMQKNNLSDTSNNAAYKLVMLDLQNSKLVYGTNSKQRQIQADRENSILKVLYFSKNMIPDSPSEPDHETLNSDDENRNVIIPTDCVLDNVEEEVAPVEQQTVQPSNVDHIKQAVDSFSLTPQMKNLLKGNMTKDFNVNNVPAFNAPPVSHAPINIDPNTLVPIHMPPPMMNMPPMNQNHQMNANHRPPQQENTNQWEFGMHPNQQINHRMPPNAHNLNNWEHSMEKPPFNPRTNNMNMRPPPPFRGPMNNRGTRHNIRPNGPRHNGPICHFLQTPNGCRFGNRCKFFHPN